MAAWTSTLMLTSSNTASTRQAGATTAIIAVHEQCVLRGGAAHDATLRTSEPDRAQRWRSNNALDGTAAHWAAIGFGHAKHFRGATRAASLMSTAVVHEHGLAGSIETHNAFHLA